MAVAMSTKARKMMITRRVEMERFSVVSSKPFQAVLAALKAAVGHPDMAEFARAAKGARTLAELEDVVRRGLGKTGLMMFMEFDHGAILRKETGLDSPKIVRLVIGNPLIMKEMAKHVPDAGSYAPVTILLDERSDGVHLTYDKMASLLAPYGNRGTDCRSGSGFEDRAPSSRVGGVTMVVTHKGIPCRVSWVHGMDHLTPSRC
jgi:uncharacterized protein (DUF302 family)